MRSRLAVEGQSHAKLRSAIGFASRADCRCGPQESRCSQCLFRHCVRLFFELHVWVGANSAVPSWPSSLLDRAVAALLQPGLVVVENGPSGRVVQVAVEMPASYPMLVAAFFNGAAERAGPRNRRGDRHSRYIVFDGVCRPFIGDLSIFSSILLTSWRRAPRSVCSINGRADFAVQLFARVRSSVSRLLRWRRRGTVTLVLLLCFLRPELSTRMQSAGSYRC